MKCDAEFSGILKLHSKKEINKTKEKLINAFACADDGAFIFNDRESMIKGYRITCDIMAKRVLIGLVGHGKKNQRLNSCTFYIQSL